MIDKIALINSIASKVGEVFNGDKSQTRKEIESNIKALVSSKLATLELVSREEFDAQIAVLRHTRARLEALEKEFAALNVKQDDNSNTADL